MYKSALYFTSVEGGVQNGKEEGTNMNMIYVHDPDHESIKMRAAEYYC